METTAPDTIYELRKDICTPNGYTRAGQRKSKAEWLKLYPNAFDLGSEEWFINVSVPVIEKTEEDKDWELIREVFDRKGLKSISYKEGAFLVLQQYKERNEKTYQQQLEGAKDIFMWLLGMTEDFPVKEQGEGNYHWRKHLRKKLEAIKIFIN